MFGWSFRFYSSIYDDGEEMELCIVIWDRRWDNNVGNCLNIFYKLK